MEDAQNEREQALDWLVGSLKPFGAPPELQVEIFGADRSDVIEMVNQVEDMLKWELQVLGNAGLTDESVAAEISAVCEEAFRLGQLDDVPDLGAVTRPEWGALRARTNELISRLRNPPADH